MLELPSRMPRRISLLAVAAIFVAAGVAHLAQPAFYLRIMPPYLPWHLELVYLSGIFEVLGGLGVLPARTRSRAGWGLAALLVAVFPANLHMALAPDAFVAEGMPLWALYARLPLQALLIAWVLWSTRPEPPRAGR